MVGKDDALRLDRGLVDSGIGGCLCNAEAEVLICGKRGGNTKVRLLLSSESQAKHQR